jgi:hypothetical protein
VLFLSFFIEKHTTLMPPKYSSESEEVSDIAENVNKPIIKERVSRFLNLQRFLV